MPIPQTILITGASSGLGASLALCYARGGNTLYLTGRDHDRLANVVTSCRERGATVFSSCINVTDRNTLAEWVLAMDSYQPIDLVIANAGISAGTGGGGETHEQVERIFNTNITGVINTIHPAIPRMQARKKGQIAIVSSLASFRGLPSAPAYSASKAAVRVYGEGLRGELAQHNIGVSVICPGYITTPMTEVNNFPMPFLMTAAKAAFIIKERLQGNPARIAFPWPMYLLTAFMGALPPFLTDAIYNRLPAKPNTVEQGDR